jgi:hypothetical protein
LLSEDAAGRLTVDVFDCGGLLVGAVFEPAPDPEQAETRIGTKTAIIIMKDFAMKRNSTGPHSFLFAGLFSFSTSLSIGEFFLCLGLRLRCLLYARRP